MPHTPDEELVRRLLAEARHDEPMPADVAARLEGVLDDLAAERRPADVPVPPRRVHDARRRRRWAVGLVAAAAAVAAIALVPRISLTSGDGAGSNASSSDAGGASSKAVRGEVPEVRRETLAADVRRTVRGLRVPGAGLAAPSPAPQDFTCADADWGPGNATPVRLDGRAAMLVLRPATGRRQVADVLECGTARVIASVTVPAP
jgi:hypothetical protein